MKPCMIYIMNLNICCVPKSDHVSFALILAHCCKVKSNSMTVKGMINYINMHSNLKFHNELST